MERILYLNVVDRNRQLFGSFRAAYCITVKQNELVLPIVSQFSSVRAFVNLLELYILYVCVCMYIYVYICIFCTS